MTSTPPVPPDNIPEHPDLEKRSATRRRPLKHHRGGSILALGIIGLVFCFIAGIIAWVMGSADLKDMRAGLMDRSGEGSTNAGRILGILGCVFQVGFFVLCIGSAIIIPMFSNAGDLAIHAKIDEDVARLQMQVELYRAQVGEYPSELSDLLQPVQTRVDINYDGKIDEDDCYGPWMNEIPIKPDGTEYSYNRDFGEVSSQSRGD